DFARTGFGPTWAGSAPTLASAASAGAKSAGRRGPGTGMSPPWNMTGPSRLPGSGDVAFIHDSRSVGDSGAARNPVGGRTTQPGADRSYRLPRATQRIDLVAKGSGRGPIKSAWPLTIVSFNSTRNGSEA